MQSHATGWSSESPTPAQLVEFFAQIKAGRITKKNLQPFLRGGSRAITIKEARQILGEGKVFGSEEWFKIFGKMVDTRMLDKIPPIPWNEEELRNPGLDQPHFLRLGIERLDGKPIDLRRWHEIYSDPKVHPRFNSDLYLSHVFAQVPCQFRWYLDVIGIVKGSEDLPYDQQEKMLSGDYDVPTGAERITANVQYSLLNGGEYLDKGFWARTKSKTGTSSENGYRVYVRCFPSVGIVVYDWDDSPVSLIGVAASRKFLIP